MKYFSLQKKAILLFEVTSIVALLFIISLASTVFWTWDHQGVVNVEKVRLIK